MGVARGLVSAGIAYAVTWLVMVTRLKVLARRRRREPSPHSAAQLLAALAQCTEPQRCAAVADLENEAAAEVAWPLVPPNDAAEYREWPWKTKYSAEAVLRRARRLEDAPKEQDEEGFISASFEEQLQDVVAQVSGDQEVVFTLLDAAYADLLQDVKTQVERMSRSLFFVSLHRGTAVKALKLGCQVALLEEASSSKKEAIYLGKYYTAMLLCAAKIRFFFFEMDVWFPRGSALEVFRRAASSPALRRPSAAWALHTDNPYMINAGLYYVRPDVDEAPFHVFDAMLSYSRRHPGVFDQGLLNCVLKRMAKSGSSELAFIRDRDNCLDSNVDLNDFAIVPLINRRPVFNWSLVDALVAASFSTPFVNGDTTAVHVLTSKPLTSSAGKKIVAKELMLWEGSGCYYCVGGGAPKYLALDHALMTRHGGDDLEAIKRMLDELIAVAMLTRRVLVLPTVYHYGRRLPAWELVDTEPLPAWRETSFFGNPKLRVDPNARVARIAVARRSIGVARAGSSSGVWYRHDEHPVRAAFAVSLEDPVARESDVLFASLVEGRGTLWRHDDFVAPPRTHEPWLQAIVDAKLNKCEYLHREKRKTGLIAAHMDCGTQRVANEALTARWENNRRVKRQQRDARLNNRTFVPNEQAPSIAMDELLDPSQATHPMLTRVGRLHQCLAFDRALRHRLRQPPPTDDDRPHDSVDVHHRARRFVFGTIPGDLPRHLFLDWGTPPAHNTSALTASAM